jgi:2-methylcitrate dehydratase PrpD
MGENAVRASLFWEIESENDPMLDTRSAPDAETKPARRLAEFAAGLTFENIPKAVIDRAKLLILDALGCGLASNAYDFSHVAVAAAAELGGEGPCSVIGRDVRLPVRDAALANGMLIHGLDFDDTHLNSIIHATAACLPCALSFGEFQGINGRELLVAYSAGMETAIRVGAAVKGGFHHAGFHATGLVAHFSSAVVAARILGLPAEGIVAAQGIAASTAAGVQVFLEEGAWTKRLHPGWAAVAGITAGVLARNGFKAPTRPYEGRFGFFDTHIQHASAPIDLNAELQTLGEVWELAETAIKPYPVCHFIHGCADAAIELHSEIGSAEITSVEVYLPRDTMPIVAEPPVAKIRPTNEYEAKFSAQFVVATCLVKGAFGLADLMPAALADSTVLDLSQRVTCAIDPDSAFPAYFSGGVRVRLKDGRILFKHVRVNSGAGERALDEAAVSKKFMASALLSIPIGQVERIRDAVLRLESHTAAEIAGLLRSTPAAER